MQSGRTALFLWFMRCPVITLNPLNGYRRKVLYLTEKFAIIFTNEPPENPQQFCGAIKSKTQWQTLQKKNRRKAVAAKTMADEKTNQNDFSIILDKSLFILQSISFLS